MTDVFVTQCVTLCFMSFFVFHTSKADNLFFASSFNNDAIYMARIPYGVSGADILSDVSFNKVVDTGSGPQQMTYDPFDEKVYWVEYGDAMIGRCDLDGSNVEKYVTPDEPGGITLDIANRVIFFSSNSTGGVLKLPISSFDTPGSASVLTKTVEYTDYDQKQIDFIPILNALIVTARSTNIKIIGPGTVSLYPNSGEVAGSELQTRWKGLPFSSLLDPVGIYATLPESAFLVDRELKIVISVEFNPNQGEEYTDDLNTIVFNGTEESEPRGNAAFGQYLYFCDFKNDTIYVAAKDGSTVFTPSELSYTLDVGGALDGCSDVHFYIEPTGSFDESHVELCDNETNTLSVNISNYGPHPHAFFVITVDDSAVGGTHFEDKSAAFGDASEVIVLDSDESAVYDLDIYNPTYERGDQHFQLMLLDINGVPLRLNGTMNVTIKSDAHCDDLSIISVPVFPSVREAWFGAFILDIAIPINDTVVDWTMRMHFRRRVFSIKIAGCKAEAMTESSDFKRSKNIGGQRSSHIVTPNASKKSYSPGDVLRLTVLGKNWKQKRFDNVSYLKAEIDLTVRRSD